MADPKSNAIDPFAHLHDEQYQSRYEHPRSTARDMITMAGRQTINLNGEWRFTLDLFDEGLRQQWFNQPLTPFNEWKIPRDYDEANSKTLTVPSVWSCVCPEWTYFEGGGWYSRSIDPIDNRSDQRLFLRVGAANYQARIFLNGRFLASHQGGSTPFFIELTTYLQKGNNRLHINVDNRRQPDRVPMHHFDWFNDGGIYRDIELVSVPQYFIKDFALSLAADDRFSTIHCHVTLSDQIDGIAKLTIPELSISQPISIIKGQGTLSVSADLRLWSPDDPYLYECRIEFGTDVVTDRIGFRDIRRQGTNLMLNGKPLYLRGVCVHEDDITQGKVSTIEDVTIRFRHAKELGCNCLRLAHYPHHEHTAKLADEMGLLLWEEIPVYWAIQFENEATYRDALNQLEELMIRDRNRASVIIWGVGNENADTDERYTFMKNLADHAKAFDPTRLVGAACLINRDLFLIEDRLAAHLDIIGLNEYFGWYEEGFEGLRQLLANSNPDRPVVISEVGADALAGHHGSETELFTEERQAFVFKNQIEIVRSISWICGFFPWLLYDFRSPRRQTSIQNGINLKGLIGKDKHTKKLAFEVIKDFYRQKTDEEAKAMAHQTS